MPPAPPEPPRPTLAPGGNMISTGGTKDEPTTGGKPWNPVRDPETGRPLAARAPKREKASSVDLEAIKARFQAQSAASRRVRAVEEAYAARLARLREFDDYERAGKPNGELTPEEIRERKELRAWRSNPKHSQLLDQARRALSAGDYDAVHRILSR